MKEKEGNMNKKGLLIIYTGNGKGKTTAALGLAVRALGHGLRVCIVQFIKKQRNCGELKLKDLYPQLLHYHVMGKGFIKDTDTIKAGHRKAAKKAWSFAEKIIRSRTYQLIILDELTYLISLSFLKEYEIVDVLMKRPERLHIVVTGRNASPLLIKAADLVTEMREIKHPFHKGVKAQKGIEW
jgi:cob(I)alamin adenosyltransferase